MTNKIYSSFFLSVFFHSIFFLILIFGVKKSVHDFKNLTYVSLIQESSNAGYNQLSSELKREEKTQKTAEPVQRKKQTLEKNQKPSKADEELLQERLYALRAKKNIVESKFPDKPQTGSLDIGSSGNLRGEAVSPSYLGLISGLIRRNWSIPETVPKNLEAVVSVRILPNGQIIIEGFEKSSGNTLFDSSVLRALRNSSPLPPPKTEVVVGLRFKP